MAHTLRLKQNYHRSRGGVIDKIGAAARAISTEHELALRAAEKAASHRQSVAEVRAMYVPALATQPDNESVEPAMKPLR